MGAMFILENGVVVKKDKPYSLGNGALFFKA
jgi:hypothetical protein